jgi:hypothetical protein
MTQIRFKGPAAKPCGGPDAIAEDCKKITDEYGEKTLPCEICKRIIRAKVLANIQADPDHFVDLVDNPTLDRLDSKGELVEYNPEMLGLKHIVSARAEKDEWFKFAIAIDQVIYSSGTVAIPMGTKCTIVRRGFRFFIYLGEYQADHANEFVWSTSDTDWLSNNLAF